MRRAVQVMLACAVMLLTACGGGTTSSSGPTRFAGVYDGTVTVAGLGVRSIRVTISTDGFVTLDVPGGVVCAGDLPGRIGLNQDVFSTTESLSCVVGGFICPLNALVSGSVTSELVTGTGQIDLGCPTGFGSFTFEFTARRS